MPKKTTAKRPAFKAHLPRGYSELVIKSLMDTLPSDCFKSKYLREEILSKYCDSKTTDPKIRKARAVQKWIASEARNYKTNFRLAFDYADFGWCTSESLILETRKLIARILGPLHYPACLSGSVYSNGASTRIPRSTYAALAKLGGSAHCSVDALKHWLVYSQGTSLMYQNLDIVPSSKQFTVPKTSEIDRVACKEPECNMLLQRGLGLTIREQLRKVGIDLRDQTRNQKLASTAFVRGLATIDLSSASDTISRQLVFELLPPEWACLLDDLRMKTVNIDGQMHELQMFSSMGNGFTFELESLLFYAITRTVCRFLKLRGSISVYGDDIIAPKKAVVPLRNVFHFLGFTMNQKKTHARGYFRESCGKHYYRSLDVSPFYIRRPVATKQDLILLLNHVLEWDGRGWGFFMNPELATWHKQWSRLIDKDLHGGVNIEDSSALVTGQPPNKRIVPVVREHPILQSLGREGLTYWLHARESTENYLSVEANIEVSHRKVLMYPKGAGYDIVRTIWVPYLIEW